MPNTSVQDVRHTTPSSSDDHTQAYARHARLIDAGLTRQLGHSKPVYSPNTALQPFLLHRKDKNTRCLYRWEPNTPEQQDYVVVTDHEDHCTLRSKSGGTSVITWRNYPRRHTTEHPMIQLQDGLGAIPVTDWLREPPEPHEHQVMCVGLLDSHL